MLTVARVATAMRRVLTEVADEAARASGCVRRVRRFSGATFVQTLVFGWLAHPAATLAQLCQMAATRGVVVQGSTVIRLPDALAAAWPGRGGGTAAGTGTAAALKLPVGLELRQSQLHGPTLHPGRQHDAVAAPPTAG